MKVKVTYGIQPSVLINAGVEVVTQFGSIILPARDGCLSEVIVVLDDHHALLLPITRLGPREGVKAEINFPPEIHKRTLELARTFVATLGLLGFGSRIDPVPRYFEWEQTRAGEPAPAIPNWSIHRRKSGQPRAARLDQLVHCVTSVDRMKKWVDIVEFFNAGIENFHSDRYADSVRYSFFVIESLFGNGKSNPKKLLFEFSRHQELAVATRSALRFPRVFPPDQHRDSVYLRHFGYRNWTGALEQLIQVRGQISHHKMFSPNCWTLGHQDRFRADAAFLANVAHRVVWRIARREMWHPDVIAACGGLRD